MLYLLQTQPQERSTDGIAFSVYGSWFWFRISPCSVFSPYVWGISPYRFWDRDFSPYRFWGRDFPLTDLRDFCGEIWKGNFPSRDWSSGEEISNQNRSQNDENFIEWGQKLFFSPAAPFNQGNFLETSLFVKIFACGAKYKDILMGKALYFGKY